MEQFALSFPHRGPELKSSGSVAGAFTDRIVLLAQDGTLKDSQYPLSGLCREAHSNIIKHMGPSRAFSCPAAEHNLAGAHAFAPTCSALPGMERGRQGMRGRLREL